MYFSFGNYFQRASDIYYLRPGESPLAKGLPFTLISIVLGWWGFPWGPIFTVTSLVTNLGGGKDVTMEVMHSLGKPANSILGLQ